MDTALDSLSADFKPVVIELLARLTERKVPVLIVQTSRTLDQQAADVKSGASGVQLSKHLPRKYRGHIAGTADDQKADAIDICPYGVYMLSGPDKLQWTDDDKGHPAFATIGELAEMMGLRWGGRWSQPHDPGHVELLFPNEVYSDIPTTSAAWQQHGVRR